MHEKVSMAKAYIKLKLVAGGKYDEKYHENLNLKLFDSSFKNIFTKDKRKKEIKGSPIFKSIQDDFEISFFHKGEEIYSYKVNVQGISPSCGTTKAKFEYSYKGMQIIGILRIDMHLYPLDMYMLLYFFYTLYGPKGMKEIINPTKKILNPTKKIIKTENEDHNQDETENKDHDQDETENKDHDQDKTENKDHNQDENAKKQQDDEGDSVLCEIVNLIINEIVQYDPFVNQRQLDSLYFAATILIIFQESNHIADKILELITFENYYEQILSNIKEDRSKYLSLKKIFLEELRDTKLQLNQYYFYDDDDDIEEINKLYYFKVGMFITSLEQLLSNILGKNEFESIRKYQFQNAIQYFGKYSQSNQENDKFEDISLEVDLAPEWLIQKKDKKDKILVSEKNGTLYFKQKYIFFEEPDSNAKIKIPYKIIESFTTKNQPFFDNEQIQKNEKSSTDNNNLQKSKIKLNKQRSEDELDTEDHNNQSNAENHKNQSNAENNENHKNQSNAENNEDQSNAENHNNQSNTENNEDQSNTENQNNQSNAENNEDQSNTENHNNQSNTENNEDQSNAENHNNQSNTENHKNQSNAENHNNQSNAENHNNQSNTENHKNQSNTENHNNQSNAENNEDQSNSIFIYDGSHLYTFRVEGERNDTIKKIKQKLTAITCKKESDLFCDKIRKSWKRDQLYVLQTKSFRRLITEPGVKVKKVLKNLLNPSTYILSDIIIMQNSCIQNEDVAIDTLYRLKKKWKKALLRTESKAKQKQLIKVTKKIFIEKVAVSSKRLFKELMDWVDLLQNTYFILIGWTDIGKKANKMYQTMKNYSMVNIHQIAPVNTGDFFNEQLIKPYMEKYTQMPKEV